MSLERATDLAPRDDDTPEARVLAGLLAARRSCRGFRPEAVPDAVIERIVELAQFAPSWCNSQPWQLIVTKGEATERLRRGLIDDIAANPETVPDEPFPLAYTGVYQERRRAVGLQLYAALGIGREDRDATQSAMMNNFWLFGAPHVAIVTSERDLGGYGAIDCGLFTAYFLLAAQSLGVATIPQAALAQRAPFLRRHFEIADNRAILFGISFGYADEGNPANGFSSHRADVREVVIWRGA